MKRSILCLLALLFIFISCDSNPCVISIYSLEEKKGFEFPQIYWIKFYPSKVKVGDTVLVMYEKEIKSNNLNYKKDFEITDSGKIKYIGTNISPYSSVFSLDENSRFLDNVLYICPQKQFDKISAIEINSFVSISNSSATSSNNEIVMLEFRIPDNAQSGYLHVPGDYFKFKNMTFSDEKLIIVDENGNEITE